MQALGVVPACPTGSSLFGSNCLQKEDIASLNDHASKTLHERFPVSQVKSQTTLLFLFRDNLQKYFPPAYRKVNKVPNPKSSSFTSVIFIATGVPRIRDVPFTLFFGIGFVAEIGAC